MLSNPEFGFGTTASEAARAFGGRIRGKTSKSLMRFCYIPFCSFFFLTCFFLLFLAFLGIVVW